MLVYTSFQRYRNRLLLHVALPGEAYVHVDIHVYHHLHIHRGYFSAWRESSPGVSRVRKQSNNLLLRGALLRQAMRCAGFDRVDLAAAEAAGIRVARVPT